MSASYKDPTLLLLEFEYLEKSEEIMRQRQEEDGTDSEKNASRRNQGTMSRQITEGGEGEAGAARTKNAVSTSFCAHETDSILEFFACR